MFQVLINGRKKSKNLGYLKISEFTNAEEKKAIEEENILPPASPGTESSYT